MDDDGCLRTLFLSATAQGQTNEASLLIDILIILFFVFINGFFSGTEMAIININDNRIRHEADNGNKLARKLLYFTENKSNFLATIQLGVTLAGFLSSAFAGEKIASRISFALDPAGLHPWIGTVSLIGTTVIVSFISLILGELVPKQIAIHNPEGFARYVVGVMRVVDVLFRPFAKFLSAVTNLILRLFRIDPDATREQVTEEEIRMMLYRGRDSGNIQINESMMIENIFEFNDKEVSEIMTHRTNLVALDADADFDEVVSVASEERYSRIPVYEDGPDDIIGILHVKDLLNYLAKKNDKPFELRKLLRPPYLTPETKHVDELFRDMQSANVAMAIVIDEYGGTSGIVTVEDLLEEIVGNIQDEYDEEQREVIRVADNVYMVEGLTSIDDLKRYLPEFELNEEDEHADYDTVAGLVLDVLGRIPDAYEHPVAHYRNYTFQVLLMEDNRIARLKLTINPQEQKDDHQEKHLNREKPDH